MKWKPILHKLVSVLHGGACHNTAETLEIQKKNPVKRIKLLLHVNFENQPP